MKMQRRLRPDSNARLEATYRHSLIRRHTRNDHGHRGRLLNDRDDGHLNEACDEPIKKLIWEFLFKPPCGYARLPFGSETLDQTKIHLL